MDGATTAGAAEAEAAAAAACRFQEGRGQELDCCSSGESPARPDIAQPIHTTLFPPLSLNPLQPLCTTPLCPPCPGECLPWLDVPWSPSWSHEVPSAGCHHWSPHWEPTSCQLEEERRLHPRPATARASFSRGRPARPSYLNTSHHIG